jgi:hypothetical protein
VKLRDWISRCDRAQRTLAFKVIASVVVVALAISAFATYYVIVTMPSLKEAAAATASAPSESAHAVQPTEGAPAKPQMSAEERSAIDAAQRLYNQLLAARTSPANLGVGLTAVTAIALAVIWLGLGLTYLALIAVAAGVVTPLWLIGWRGSARLLGGVVVLFAAFAALMQVLRLAVSGPGPVMAIARNLLAEAVRMKVSLVFILLLVFALAYLPGWLNPEGVPPDQLPPLRYRVQSFLQYGTGGSFWIIAVLVLFFGAASVSFEQRDKQIWQTMTKPVAAWQYILGKWIGLSGLAAVLLAVCCTGVFLFTEFLRQQPAVGEARQLVAQSGQGLTEDRMILETQVLAARQSVQPVVPMSMDDPEFIRGAEAFIADNRTRDPEFATTPAMQEKVISDLFRSLQMRYRSIEPGVYQVFRFTGLSEAKRKADLLVLRYKIEAGTNAPDTLYKLTFNFNGVFHEPTEVTLGNVHTLQLLPAVISDKGEVELALYNGAVLKGPDGSPAIIPNPGMVSIPADGLELNYSASTYQMNFFRVAAILWVKLAFLAMLAITAATFLSFPVACLVAFSVFLMAEGTGFLTLSLEYFDALQPGEKTVTYWKVFVRAIGLTVAWMFKTYSELRPRPSWWMASSWGGGA